MDSVWVSVVIFVILAALVWLMVRALRTRDAGAPPESLETTRVASRTPGMHDIDNEQSLRARGILPPRK